MLLEAAQKLERDVLVPLNELAQTTLFSYEILQETYCSQVELLEGNGDATDRNNTTSSSSSSSSDTSAASAAPTLSLGIKKIVSNLNVEHDALAERVRRIQERFAAQRETAEGHLAFAVSQRAKVWGKLFMKSYFESHFLYICDSFLTSRCPRPRGFTSASWRTGPRW